MNNSTMTVLPRVALLGLGAMGTALARRLLATGHPVTVWNRSHRDLTAHGLADAQPSPRPEDAVCAADVVIICVRDHDASRAVLEQAAGSVRPGAPVVNLSTGTSRQAVESARTAGDQGLTYLTGAIMVPTPLIGTEHNLTLYAGSSDVVAAARPVLDALGGTVDVVGEDHALPPVLDMAMLDIYFAGMYAFLHSAAMVRAHGIEPEQYLPYATGIVDTLQSSLPGLADSFTRRDYSAGEARLDMCLSFLEHVVATSELAGVDPALPALIRDATRRQAELGHHDQDWDRVAEGLLT